MNLARIAVFILSLASIATGTSLDAGAAPIAVPDSVTTTINESVSFDVLKNDARKATLVDHTEPSHGQLINRDGGKFSYLPDANFLGQDSFTYRAETGDAMVETTVVTIEITGQITAVEARDDDTATDEDVPVLTYVLANDGQGPSGAALSVTITSGPAHGAAEVQADGSILYSPEANWSGADSYGYEISDGSTTDSATVTLNVESVEEPPDAIDDAAFTRQDNSASIDVFANDGEADGDGFALVEHSQPLNGTATWSDLDHMIIYLPNPGFWGTDQFTYTIGDIDGYDTALVMVTVNGVPVAQDDVAIAEQFGAVNVSVLENDSDPEVDALVVSSVGTAEHGSAVINPDMTIHYSPDHDYVGPDSFLYTVQDANGNSANATVTVTVEKRATQATGAVDDEFLILEDSPGNTLDILSNDTVSSAAAVSISIDSAPSHGSVTLDAMQLVTYVPDASFSGQDSFTYSIGDGTNPRSSATVSIEVQAVNDLPVAAPDTVTIDEDTDIRIDAISNDSDPDGGLLTVESLTAPVNGTAVVARDGAISYQPRKDFSGIDSFDYVVGDDGGSTAISTITVTVNPINDAPTAADDKHRLEIDASEEIDVLQNDQDPDGPQVFLTIMAQPSHGSAFVTGNNTISYVPEAKFEGYDSVEYQYSDGYLSSSATVSITIGDPNTAPVAKDDLVRTVTDRPVEIAILKNDTDADDDELVIYGVTEPEHGTLTFDGSEFTYTPDPGFVGADSFTYKVRDDNGGRDRASVEIDVNPAKDRRSNEK
jgi:large repetitive protein